MLLSIRLVTGLLRIDRDEIIKAIAAVDIHAAANRPKPVSRVLIAAMADIPPHTPVIGVDIRKYALPAIVQVAAFTVQKIAEHLLAAKIVSEHFRFAVDAVFKLHTVATRSFRCFNEFPALVNIHRGRNFNHHVLACLHCVDAVLRVEIPRRSTVNDIDTVKIAKRLPTFVAAEFTRGRRALLLKNFTRTDDLRVDIVANSRNLNTRQPHKALNSTPAALAQADNADTNAL